MTLWQRRNGLYTAADKALVRRVPVAIAGGMFNIQTLTDTGGSSSRYGTSVAVDGNVLVVGDPYSAYGGGVPGSVHVYERASSSDPWVHVIRIDGSVDSSLFGIAVDVYGDLLVIGSPLKPVGYGAVHVYRKVAGTWTFEQTIGQATYLNRNMGRNIAIDRSDPTRFVVNGDGTSNIGMAWVVELNGAWSATALVPAVLLVGQNYGHDVGMHGDWIATSIPGSNEAIGGGGTVIMWHWNGVNWAEGQHVYASDACASCQIGFAVSLLNDVLAVTSPYTLNPSGVNAGTLYIYDLSGGVWVQRSLIQPDDLQTGDKLGNDIYSALSLYDNGLGCFVGASLADPEGIISAGSTWAIHADPDWASGWTETYLFETPPVVSAQWGASAYSDGSTFVVGAPFLGGGRITTFEIS